MGLFDSIKKFVDNIFGAIGDVLGYVLGIDTDLEDKYKGQLINKSSNIQKIPVIYGERLVGGTRVFVSTGGGKKNQYLYIALVLSEGEVDSIGDIYINDIISTDSRFTNKATIYKYRGTDNQAATTLFADADESWTSAHQLKGVAYLAMRFKYDQDVFTSIPEIRAVVKGKKVYNPATQITEWSDNPALCLRDYLTNPRYGKGLPASAIDDASIIQAASDCDSLVTPYGGATDIPLFKFNAIIDTGETVFDNVKKIIASMRGILPYSNGKYSLLVDKDQSSTFTLTEDNILSDIKIVSSSKENKFNQVTAKFPNPAKRWELDTVTYPDSGSTEETAFLNEDNQQILSKEITLHNVTNAYRAKDLARIACLASRRQSLTVSVTCTSEALNIAVGDIVTIEHDSLGWTGTAVQEFRVMGMVLDDSGEVDLTLQQYDASIYPWVEQSEIPDNPETTLPDPFTTAPVTNQSGTGQAVVQNDGTVTYFYDLEWDEPDDALVEYYLIDVNKTIDEVETLAAETLQTQNLNFRYMVSDTSIDYGFTIRAVNGAGTRSAGVTIPASSVIKDTTPPSVIDAQTTSVVAGLQSITVSWENPTEEDFDLVRIKVNDTNTEPTSHFAATRSDTFIHDIGEYSTIKYYWIAPVDTSGNVADYTFAGSATTGSIDYGDVLNPPTIPEVATTAYLTLSDSNAPTDTEFNTAVGRDPIENDFVVVSYEALVEGETVTRTKAYVYKTVSPAEVPDWTEVAEYIDGSMLVSGSLSASDITTGTLNASVVTIENLEIGYGSVTDTPDLSVYLTDGDIEDFVTLEDVNQSSFAPYQSWDFRNTLDGWAVGGITTANNTDFITLTSTTTDPTFNKTGLSIDGGLYDTVLVRIRRTAGTGWQGTLYYSTSGHGASESYRQIVPDTTVLNEWVILTYDMYNLNAGGDDWKNNTITELRFDWGNGTPDDVFDVDWVSVGKRGSIPISQTDISEFITGGDVNANVTSISGGVIQTGTAVTVGTSNNVAILSGADADYRIWAGNASPSLANFKVHKDGTVYATNAVISGDITAGTINADNITFTGTLTADNLAGIPNVEALNMTQSMRNEIEEIIVTKFGSDASTGYYDEATGSFDAQDDDTEVCKILAFQHNGSNIDIDLTFSKSWQASSGDIPSVEVKIQRAPAGTTTWTTIKTQTVTGSTFYESELGSWFANIQGYVSATDNPATGNYDYRFLTGNVLNLSLISLSAKLEANEQGEQIGTIDLANYSALAQDETITGNWTFSGTTSGISYDNLDNKPTIPDISGKADLSGDTFTGKVIYTGRTTDSAGTSTYVASDATLTRYISNVATEYHSGASGEPVTIYFKSGVNAPSDFGYITFDPKRDTATERAELVIGCENDGNSTSGPDRVKIASPLVIDSKLLASDHTNIVEFHFNGVEKGYITTAGNLQLDGSITASGYNASNWDTAYTYSQVGHLPLSGGSLSGNLTVGSSANGSSLIINDIGGARYRLATGAYDLKFQKHDADADNYATALELRGVNANDGTPSVYVNNDLDVANDIKKGGFTVIDSGRNLTNVGTISLAGTSNRPMFVGQAGSITTKGSSGGWSQGLLYYGSSNTYKGGFGALGTADTLDYFWIGSEYNDGSNFRFYPNGTFNIGGTTVIDSSRNATFATTNTSKLNVTQLAELPTVGMTYYTNNWSYLNGGENGLIISTKSNGAEILRIDSSSNLSLGGTAVIDSARNLYNINTLAVNGARPSNTQAHIQSTLQYALELEHNLNSASEVYYDTLSLLNDTNQAGNLTQIGFRTRDGDGQHHRATIVSRRDGSGYVAGELIVRTRTVSGTPTDALTVKSNGDVRVDRGKLYIESRGYIQGNGDNTISVRSSHVDGYVKIGGVNGDFYELYSGAIYPNADNARSLGISNRRFTDCYLSGSVKADSGYQVGGITVIDSARNISNIGSISSSGNHTMSGDSYTLYGPNSTWGRYLQVGGNGRQYVNDTAVASVATTDGNLHIDCASGKGTYLNYYDGNYVYFGNGANATVGTVDSAGKATFNRFISSSNLMGFAGSGLASDGYPYARITEGWGVSMNPPDARWAPNVPNASFLVGLTSSGANFGGGNIIATGNITAYYSDERLKERISGIENPLDKVCSLDGFIYTENELAKSVGYNCDKPQLGLSAQQVQKVAPEIVSLAPFDMTGDNDPNGDGKIYSKSGENYLTVDYARLVPMLVEAIKELKSEIEELKNGNHAN